MLRPSSVCADASGSCGQPRWGVFPILLALFWVLLATGCGSKPDSADGQSTSVDSDAPTERTAKNDLQATKDSVQRILDRYVKAASYSDVAKISLSYKLDGQEFDEPASIAVQFQRPNQVRLEIKRGINVLRLVSDGRQMWTTIEDPVTQNLGGQTVQVAAPDRLSTAQIYSATELVDPSQPDEALTALFGMPVTLELSQVGLLLDGLAFRHLLNSAVGIKRLENQAIDGVDHQRFRITSAEGDYTFWSDARRAVLRRIEYPIKGLQAQMPEGSVLEDVRFQADFEDVRFDPLDASTFSFQPAANATLVRFFVLPPLQLPTGKYNAIIPEYDLATLDGGSESSSQWADKLKVLTWFHDHPTSRSVMPRLQQMMRQPGMEQVVFRGVFTEPIDSFADQKLRELITDWGLSISVLRDLNAVGRDQFEITDAPTTVVLDQENRLQAFVVGASPQLGPTLSNVLQRLTAGDNVAADVQQRVVAEQAAFEKQLSMARITVDPAQAPVTVVAEASEPQQLAKTQRWRNEEIEAAGNLMVVSGDPFRCVVLDGISQVVELDGKGAVVARHELPIAETSGVSKLRTAVDRQGRRFFLGFVQFGEQLHVFDERFGHLTTYPDVAQQGARILDAQIIDLDEDGELELYVGFADPVGLHRVSLMGQRQWSNRASPSVMSLVPRWLATPTYLLTTSDDGSIRPVSCSGREGPSIPVKNRLLHQLAVSQSSETRKTQFVGMSFTLEGRLIAVGLDPQLKEAWSYGLPAGTYTSQVETPLSAELLGGGSRQWVFTGPDGSIHLVNDDGSFFDFFNTGEQVNGVAAVGSSGVGKLIISTPNGVTAYEIQRR